MQNLGTPLSMSEPPKVGVKDSNGAQVMTIEGRRSPDTQSSNDSSKVGKLAGPQPHTKLMQKRIEHLTQQWLEANPHALLGWREG